MTTRDRQRKSRKTARQYWPGAKVTGSGSYALLDCPQKTILLFEDLAEAHAWRSMLDLCGCGAYCRVRQEPISHLIAFIEGRP